MITCDFKKHGPEYLARTLYRRPREEGVFMVDAANKIKFDKHIENYLLVPVHVSETCVGDYLRLIKTSLSSVRLNILFFINGNIRHMGEREFTELADTITQEINEESKSLNASAHVLKKYYRKKQTIGQIRGTMCDIIVLSALASRQEHPKIVFNDVDALALSENYFEILFEKLTPRNIKMVVGPIYYGYGGTRLYGLAEPCHLPELFLYNHLNQSILRCTRNGTINYEKRMLADGPSMAFPASIYCAAGGFDWAMTQAEDYNLNYAIHRYSPNVFVEGISDRLELRLPDNHLYFHYSPESWMVTDPRRPLATIAKGLTGIEAWSNHDWEQTLGSELSYAGLVASYRDSPSVIQIEDLKAAVDYDDPTSQNKIVNRVLEIALQTITVEGRIRDEREAHAFLRDAGILAKSVDCPLEMQPLRNIVTWRNCKLIHQLCRLQATEEKIGRPLHAEINR